MKLPEILQLEDHNQTEIHLFKQGIFYRAYERSCLALQKIKPCTITKKICATTGLEYIYSGFPTTALKKYTAQKPLAHLTDNHILLNAIHITDQELIQTKQTTPLKTPNTKK